MKRLLVLAVVCSITSMVAGDIIGVDVGPDCPRPDTLAGCPLEALPFDPRPVFGDVTDAPGNPPLTGDLGFSIPMSLRQIGMGWATWSCHYTGVVYYSNGATSATLTLPSGTVEFLMYVEPNPFSWQTITATEASGVSITQSVHGSSGAAGFGFYGTEGDTITSIRIDATSDFAWGEFYGCVPEPASLGLLGLGALLVLRRR